MNSRQILDITASKRTHPVYTTHPSLTSKRVFVGLKRWNLLRKFIFELAVDCVDVLFCCRQALTIYSLCVHCTNSLRCSMRIHCDPDDFSHSPDILCSCRRRIISMRRMSTLFLLRNWRRMKCLTKKNYVKSVEKHVMITEWNDA